MIKAGVLYLKPINKFKYNTLKFILKNYYSVAMATELMTIPYYNIITNQIDKS